MKKKGIKRLLAMVFAFVLMFSCMGTAWAADKGTIIITNVQSDAHTYSAYRIFSGTVNDDGDTIGNVEWGSGVSSGDAVLAALKADSTLGSLFSNCSSAADVAEVLAGYSDDSDILLAFADVVATYKGTAAQTVTGGTQSGSSYTYTIDNLDAGYYLVIDETDSSKIGSGEAYTHYIVKVVGTVNVEVKEVNPTVTKKIVKNDGTEADATSASAGDTVTFKLTGTIPSDLTAYSTYTYKFVDTLSKNLTYDSDSLSVEATAFVETTDTSWQSEETYYTYDSANKTYTLATGSTFETGVTYFVKKTTTLTEDSDYKVEITIDTDTKETTLTVTLNNAVQRSGHTITVTYSATLKESAVSSDAETNSVYLVYSNNPNKESDAGETSIHKVYVYTFDLNVNKVDENDDPLSGAAFTLYKLANITKFEKDVTYYTYKDGVMAAVDSSASYSDSEVYYVQVGIKTADAVYDNETLVSCTAGFEDLGEGDYILIETTVPAGYNTLDPVEFTIKATYGTDGSSVTKLTMIIGSDSKAAASTTTLTTTVENQKGSTLPETGGRGTTMFYIIGGILVFGAAVLLITRRRMSGEK